MQIGLIGATQKGRHFSAPIILIGVTGPADKNIVL